MARNQDRSVVNVYPPQSFYYTLASAPNAISTNREGSQCAVGGRNLLKIFSIEEQRFVERTNLVVGPRKLNYSITDVQWHPLEENLIASAAGNGVVILWDLNKVNESKQDHIFQQHYRFVNKISFHPTDGALLMSCSQDGNMNCFDIRRKEVAMKFCGKTDSIRDVQFHPTEKYIFCSACESGNVQLWDMRKPDHYYNQFAAHIGPVFTLHWHPEERFWLGTGGRNYIKVWDTQPRSQLTHIIQTIAPAARIKWRPGYKYHIASCALVLDNNVNIWDIRRAFIPFAAFQEHKDVTTGIMWQKDPDVILSCSKDKVLFHHVISDAERPAEKAPPIALSLSPSGVVGHAFPSKMLKLTPPKLSLTRVNLGIQQVYTKRQNSQDFTPENSVLNFYDVKTVLDEYWLERSAREYIFFGRPFSALCDHNAQVAEKLGLQDKAQTWIILKQLYSNEEATRHQSQTTPSPSPLSLPSISNPLLMNDGRKMETPESFIGVNMKYGSSSSEDDLASTGANTPSGLVHNPNYNDMTLVGPELDAVFGDDDYNAQLFSAEMGVDEDELDCLPSEAFQLRHSFGEKAIQHKSDDMESEGENPEKIDSKPYRLDPPKWNFEGLVKDMLFHYAEQGDLQMCVTVLLALKDMGKGMVEFSIQEEWFSGYLEILFRLHLFNIATEVISHSPEPVNLLNQKSTTVHIQCGNCNKAIPGAQKGWYCRNCQEIAQVCSICHIPVKGLYVWCQGCGHGGHLFHLKSWFEKKKFCPAGCGHKCEYS